MLAFAGLTYELCAEAYAVVDPLIRRAMKDGKVKRSHGNMVVLDPKIPREPKYQSWSVNPDDPFEKLILAEFKWGLTADWEHAYQAVSRSKAFASWKTGLSTREIQQLAPWLYEEGWTKWPGSAVSNGLVVAFSGVEDYFDEMFSEVMLAAIKGLCLREVLGPDGVMANTSLTFLGN